MALEQMDLYGFKKISIFTTNNCCNERDFMTGNSNEGKSPVFPALACKTGAEVEVEVEAVNSL